MGETVTVTGENQWFEPHVRNRLDKPIILTNFNIKYGKFFNINHRFNEVPGPQGKSIGAGTDLIWGHCGRASSPSGTEGSFEVRIQGTNQKIGEVYWDCPYIGDNKIISRNTTAGFEISIADFSIPGGALGRGKISVRKD